MFTVGLDRESKSYFTAATMIIAIPTSIKVFSWISTIFSGSIRLTVSTLYSLGFVFLFTLGGFTGVILSNGSINVAFLDSYYVVGLFLYVLSLGAVSAILGGFYLFSPRLMGRSYNRILGKIQFYLFMLGVNITFFPMLSLGLGGLPRRYSDYSDQYSGWNTIATYGTYITSVSLIVLFVLIYDQLVNGKIGESNMVLKEGFFYNRNNGELDKKIIVKGLEYMVDNPVFILTFKELPILTQIAVETK